MRVLLSTYVPRGEVESPVGLAAPLRALGAEPRACAPPDFAELRAELATAQLDSVPLAPVGSDALVATDVMPVGVQR